MVAASDVSWGKYKGFEGPWFKGKVPFAAGRVVTSNQKVLAVITAAEGGRYDAVNMYDRCIISSGLCQACEAGNYLTSDLLGAVARAAPHALGPVEEMAAIRGASFRPNGRGRYRFFFSDQRGEVDRVDEQRQLFLGTSSGEKGSWDDASKEIAIAWAAAVGTCLGHPDALLPQVDFWVPRLRSFAMPEAREYMFGEYPVSGGGADWVGAAQAAFLSFAVNLPSVASEHLLRFAKTTTTKKGSKEWVVDMLRALTFGPAITIWPRRYDEVRPVLERLYGVDLPDMSEELRAAKTFWSTCVMDYPEEELDTVQEVQAALVRARYDIGPAGADGIAGPKTRAAIMDMQRRVGLPTTGLMDPKTKAALWAVSQ